MFSWGGTFQVPYTFHCKGVFKRSVPGSLPTNTAHAAVSIRIYSYLFLRHAYLFVSIRIYPYLFVSIRIYFGCVSIFIDTRIYSYLFWGVAYLFVSIRIYFSKNRYSYLFVSILRRWTPEKYKENGAYLFSKK